MARHGFFLMSPQDMREVDFLIMTIVEIFLGHNVFEKPEWMNDPLAAVAVVLEGVNGSPQRINVRFLKPITRAFYAKVIDGMKAEDFAIMLGYRLVTLFKMRSDLNVIWTESSMITPSREASRILFEIDLSIAGR